MITNVISKTCLNHAKNYENFEFHSGSEVYSRLAARNFRGDYPQNFGLQAGYEVSRMSETESYPKAEYFRKPNSPEHLPNVPKCGLNTLPNTRHDNREVKLSTNFAL